MPDVKHVGLFGSVRLRRMAQRDGFGDVLFTDADATVSEAATSNIGFVEGDQIIWPQADCLPGVTLDLIDQVQGGLARTAPITLGQLADVDAVFATNAAVGIRTISAIDDMRWPNAHPVLRVLHKLYSDIPAELL